MEVVRRRRLSRGEAHAVVERTLSEAGHLAGLAALALFDDVERGGEVLERLQREAGAPLADTFRRCEENGEIPPAAAVDLVRLASKLTAWLRGLS
jgi:hypothetical protein